MRRLFIDIIILVAVVVGWWYAALLVALFGLFTSKNYFEIIVFGVVYDALFRMVPHSGIHGYIGTLLTTILFIAHFIIKRIIRK